MRLTQCVHDQLKAHLEPWVILAIDVTVYNGYDSLLLAELVGITGRVCGIDIQAAAIETTRKRLHEAGHLTQAQLHQENTTVLAALAKQSPNTAQAIVFNLGVTSIGNKLIQTQTNDTSLALEASSELLAPKGLLIVTAYRGHPGGTEEAEAVATWVQQRKAMDWTIGFDSESSCKNPQLYVRIYSPTATP